MGTDGQLVEVGAKALRRISARRRGSGDRAARVAHDGRCSYCGRTFGSTILWRGKGRILGLVYDHLVPVGAGGTNGPDNSIAACTVCNQVKGSSVFGSFAEARLFVLSELGRLGAVLLSEASACPKPAIKCEFCGSEFVSAFSRARFCSSKCRSSHWDTEHPRMNQDSEGWVRCGACARPFLARRRDQKYCSGKCSDKGYNREHPVTRRGEQAAMDFLPAARELGAEAERRESKAAAILERLRRGPATSLELLRVGGIRYSARIFELRRAGHRITTEDRLDHAVYTLEAAE